VLAGPRNSLLQGVFEHARDLIALARRSEDVDRRQFLASAAAGSLSLAFGPRAFGATTKGWPVALVTADLESHVVVLDLRTARVVKRIATGPGPRAIEHIHGPFGSTVLVAHTEHGVVTLIGAQSLSIRRSELDVFEEPRYACGSPLGRLRGPVIAYVTDSAAEEIVTIDVSGRGRVLWRTRVPGPARHISISPDGSTIWTALGTAASEVAVLDASDPRRPKLWRTIRPPFLAHDVAFAPDSRHVWITSGSERRIAIYRNGSGHPSRILDAGAAPQHVTFSREKVFVASGDDGTVRRHRLDGALVREARVPTGSYNVAFGFDRLVTPSLGRGTVTFLDRNGRVAAVRRVARAAHDACIVLGP
jgi:DNA-binding beta-propeller fold protein YncE